MSSLSSVLSSASAALQTQSGIASGEGVDTNPSYFKYIGIALAVMSGVLIGSSFVFKKKGLLASQRKYETVAGEGYQYLKSPMWWSGMTLMILGEGLNFGAYAFAPAILVTPFGALSVVLCAILSSIFLKEALTLFGKIGCFLCVIGSVIIALNGPSGHNGGSIVEFRKLFLSVGFLVWAGVCIAASLFLIFFVSPKKGQQWMMVDITICSLLGGLSVSTTSGIGSAIVLTIRGSNQLKNWFFYVLLAFVAITLVAEIVFLNRALARHNTALVTPSYFVVFTSASIISTIILFKGLDADASTIITLVLGFLTTCTGVVLLQLSKVDPEELEAKEGSVPGLDRSTTLLMRASRSMVSTRSEKDGLQRGASSTAIEDPGIDTIRGGAGLIGSIIRARSSRRIRASADEYNRLGTVSGDASFSRDAGMGMHQLNSGRRGDLQRYELSDGPILEDESATSIPRKRGSGSDAKQGRLNGMLSPPPSATSGNFPKRGESMISFTSESLEPHGHHAAGVTSPTSDSFHPTSKAPTGGILAHSSPTTAQPAAPFLNPHHASPGGRALSNISEARSSHQPYPPSVLDAYDEEKVLDYDEGDDIKAHNKAHDSFASTTSTTAGLYEDPFAKGIPTHLLLNDDGAQGGAEGQQQKKPRNLRHMFDPSSGFSQQQQQKQYTAKQFPGGSGSASRESKASSILNKAKRKKGSKSEAEGGGGTSGLPSRRSEEELLSPQLVNERWGQDSDEDDDGKAEGSDDDERRPSIRIVTDDDESTGQLGLSSSPGKMDVSLPTADGQEEKGGGRGRWF
ncbi:DUF803-domain-containing protein [Jaminaea rosea]|uniref:DUF803-domain-containing protein n=1 Tax=Jaminaea rosea TaxID=1569628 RepID=A0A316V012_9BASI|nr:DUF803-domain-containing protein [Jaminaea rosea]PWN30890.1 DUF803-domain-containing protein [Jaminaea rosea]